MDFAETLRLAMASIWGSKLRSALTLLGMIIGVTAVVVVVSMVQGFNNYIEEKIAGIGAKSFSVNRFSFDDFKNTEAITLAQRRNKELTWDDFEYIRDHARLIRQIGAKARPSGATAKVGNEVAEGVTVDGATANIVDIESVDVAEGRYFTASENDSAQNVAFVGADIANKLFPGTNALDREFTLNGLPYRVIGVAAVKGTIFGMPQDSFAVLPLRTYEKNFGQLVRQRSFYMVATAVNDDQFAEAVEEARFLMRARRELKMSEKDTFGIGTPDAVLGFRDRLLGPIFIVAIAVPAIALVVGGIVIMNIMLVSVTERTREIGIRKALGARRNDILKQFLVEAVMLSALGGAVGVFLAWVIGQALTKFVFRTSLSTAAVIVAVAVSAVVGILSGLLPARKAALLDPIVALRSE
ncbi:MAG: ABC transporter permease [Blastocatellia bacterium]